MSGFLLQLNSLGLKSWQRMFILEGIPSVLLGFVVLHFLTDHPSQAVWLTEEQRTWLTTEMDPERARPCRSPAGMTTGSLRCCVRC